MQLQTSSYPEESPDKPTCAPFYKAHDAIARIFFEAYRVTRTLEGDIDKLGIPEQTRDAVRRALAAYERVQSQLHGSEISPLIEQAWQREGHGVRQDVPAGPHDLPGDYFVDHKLPEASDGNSMRVWCVPNRGLSSRRWEKEYPEGFSLGTHTPEKHFLRQGLFLVLSGVERVWGIVDHDPKRGRIDGVWGLEISADRNLNVGGQPLPLGMFVGSVQRENWHMGKYAGWTRDERHINGHRVSGLSYGIIDEASVLSQTSPWGSKGFIPNPTHGSSLYPGKSDIH